MLVIIATKPLKAKKKGQHLGVHNATAYQRAKEKIVFSGV